jgi:hypothetical protein
MRRIYKNAELVLSWLGPEDHSLALDNISTIAVETQICEAEKQGTFPELKWMERYPELCRDYNLEGEGPPEQNP